MNVETFETESAFLRATAMPPKRLFRAYWTEARYETLRTLRLPAFGAPFLLLPVALYLLFAVVLFGAALKSEPRLAAAYFVGWCVFGVMGPGLFGFGIFVATEREQGLLTLKRAQPMPAAAYLLAKMWMALAFGVLILASMVAAALFAGHPALSLPRLLAAAGTTLLGTLPFCALGLFLGTRVSAKAAPALTNLLYLPMIYLSGFLLPLPKSMAVVEIFSPAYHLDQLALRAAGLPAQGQPLLQAAVLIGLTAALLALSIRRLKRVG